MEDFPLIWTEGLRSSLFKNGAKGNTKNYRGLTILPIFEKLFEIIVQRRMKWLS